MWLKTLASGEWETAQEVSRVQTLAACALQLGHPQNALATGHANAVLIGTQHCACWFVVCGVFYCGSPELNDVCT
jgi:hypothetical protein